MPIIQTQKQLRPRDPKDHYPTPSGLCEATVKIIPEMPEYPYILDPGAGAGPWGDAARKRWRDAYIVGVEMDSDKFANKPDSYSRWFSQNYLEFHTTYHSWIKGGFDLIIGNPPYGVGADGKKDRKLAEKFVKHSWKLLNPEGYIVFLLRTAFSCGQDRAKRFWPNYPLKDKYDLGRRPSFTGNKKTDATDYAIFIWQRNYSGLTYVGHRLMWDYKDDLR